jgi:hypothetical protein
VEVVERHAGEGARAACPAPDELSGAATLANAQATELPDGEATIAASLLLVREAILMVASGAAARVVLAGRPVSIGVVDRARRLALEAGVRVIILPRNDAVGHDLAIEQIRS